MALGVASSRHLLGEARAKLEKEDVAPSGVGNESSRMRTISNLLHASCHNMTQLFSVSEMAMMGLVASFKVASCKSAYLYLNTLIDEHVHRKHPVPKCMGRGQAHLSRSINGIGGRTKAEEFDLYIMNYCICLPSMGLADVTVSSLWMLRSI